MRIYTCATCIYVCAYKNIYSGMLTKFVIGAAFLSRVSDEAWSDWKGKEAEHSFGWTHEWAEEVSGTYIKQIVIL